MYCACLIDTKEPHRFNACIFCVCALIQPWLSSENTSTTGYTSHSRIGSAISHQGSSALCGYSRALGEPQYGIYCYGTVCSGFPEAHSPLHAVTGSSSLHLICLTLGMHITSTILKFLLVTTYKIIPAL